MIELGQVVKQSVVSRSFICKQGVVDAGCSMDEFLSLIKIFCPQSEALLDPHQALSPAQRDIQRQNTLQLIRSTLQIPESETELQETMNLIQELNSVKIVLVRNGDESDAETETLFETGWPQFYESAATHCGLCNNSLFKGGQG